MTDLGAYQLAVGYWEWWADDVYRKVTFTQPDKKDFVLFTIDGFMHHKSLLKGSKVTSLEYNRSRQHAKMEVIKLSKVDNIQLNLTVS